MSQTIDRPIPQPWMQACPCALLVSRAGQPVWGNAGLAQLLGLAPRDLEAEVARDPRVVALLSVEEGAELTRADGSTTRLSRSHARWSDGGDAEVELHFFVDRGEVSRLRRERDELARKVEELTLTDALTGLANRRALGQALGVQVTRSRRYHNPLSIALVQMTVPGWKTPYPDAVVLAVSRFLRDRLRWADVIGRFADDLFLLILPETGLAAAEALLREIRSEAGQLELASSSGNLRPDLSLGIAEWRKGLDGARLVEEARRRLADGVGAARQRG